MRKTNVTQVLFAEAIINHMVKHFEVEPVMATFYTHQYVDNIDANDPTTQHIGPDYFAIQILMAEKVIPYRPI